MKAFLRGLKTLIFSVASLLTYVVTSHLVAIASNSDPRARWPWAWGLGILAAILWIMLAGLLGYEQIIKQLASLRREVAEYGDERQTAGYLAGVRDAAGGSHIRSVS